MIKRLIHRIISPKSYDKDKARQEFILNVLLGSSILLSFFALLSDIYSQLVNIQVDGAVSPFILLSFTIFLVVLYWLSRIGKVTLSALLLIGFFYLAGLYTFFKWGTDVTQAWMIYSFLIVMSGVLVGTRFAFFLTLSLVFVSSGLSYLQLNGFYTLSSSWRNVPYTFADTVVLNITLLVIAVVAWLSNRETEKSLRRARESEAELKQERNLLEIKVEERTKELKQAQLEKVTQLYRFAEIGRLSSCLFHDLVTPLSMISLNLEELRNNYQKEKIEDIQVLLKRAMQGTKYLETSVQAVRQQLQNQESKKMFSLNKEIKKILQLVQHKLRGMNLRIIFNSTKEIKMYGSNVKFSQIVTNLLLNAIDAYDGNVTAENKREIILSLSRQRNSVVFTITDFGMGINEKDLNDIFQPFFTTKSTDKGTGIGLSISKEIIEKSFQGDISVSSTKGVGSTFTVTFPDIKKKTEKKKKYALLKNNN